jgi:hypothetical protein
MRLPKIFSALLPAAVHESDEAALSLIGDHKRTRTPHTVGLFVVLHRVRLLLSIHSADISTAHDSDGGRRIGRMEYRIDEPIAGMSDDGECPMAIMPTDSVQTYIRWNRRPEGKPFRVVAWAGGPHRGKKGEGKDKRLCPHLLNGSSEKERKDIRKGDRGESPEIRGLSGKRGREIIVMAGQHPPCDYIMAWNCTSISLFAFGYTRRQFNN